MEKKVTTRARVQVTLEFDTGDTWNPDAPVAQVYEQAAASAVHIIERMARPGSVGHIPTVTVIARPRVVAILTREAE